MSVTYLRAPAPPRPARPLPHTAFDRVALICISATLVFAIVCVFIASIWPIGAAQCVFFLLGFAFLARAAMARRLPAFHWIVAAFGAMTLWGLLQLLLARSVNRFETWSAALRFAACFSLLFVCRQIFESPRLRDTFRDWAVYFGCLFSFVAIIQHFTADGRIFWLLKTQYTTYAMGPFVNRDHYAALIELLFPLALWQSFADRRRSLQFALMASVMFVSVVTSASRAGFLLVALELIFVLALSRRADRGMQPAAPYRAMAATMVLIVAFGFVVGWDVLLDRFKAGTSDEIRWQLWQACGRMAKDRPGMGFGLGAFETAYPSYATFDAGARVDHAHNDWAEWTADGGFPFSGLMLMVAAAAFRMAVRCPWGVGVAAVFLHSVVDFPLQEPAILFATLAVLAALAREYRDGA